MKINELRRSSPMSPRMNGVSQFMEYISNITAKQMRRTFVSFTSIDKLGINPGSTYSTPVGIYAYPADYVRRMVNRYCGINGIQDYKDVPGFEKVVPFAGDAAFFNVFEVTGNVIDLADDTSCEEAIQAVKDSTGISDITLPNDYKQADLSATFWSMTLFVANGRKEKLLKASKEESMRTARRWTTVFRKASIDGVVDSEGFGVIHSNEPTQAVFFNPSIIKNVKRFVNSKQSGSSSKQPLTQSKVGYYFTKRLLTPAVVEQVKPILYRALINHVLSGATDDEKATDQAIGRKKESFTQLSEILNTAWKSNGFQFGSYNSLMGQVFSNVAEETITWINPYELQVTDMAKLHSTVKWFTDLKFRETWNRFVKGIATELQMMSRRLRSDSPEFAKWVDQVVPDRLKDDIPR